MIVVIGYLLNVFCVIFGICLAAYWYKKYPKHWVWEAAPITVAFAMLAGVPYLLFVTYCLIGLYILVYNLTEGPKNER